MVQMHNENILTSWKSQTIKNDLVVFVKACEWGSVTTTFAIEGFLVP